MSEIIDFLNFNFKARMAKCKLSGNHDRFANFIRNRPYLFLYWELQQDGPIEIQNMAIPELPDGARRDSLTKPVPIGSLMMEEVRRKIL
jgi:hypothetical protein